MRRRIRGFVLHVDDGREWLHNPFATSSENTCMVTYYRRGDGDEYYVARGVGPTPLAAYEHARAQIREWYASRCPEARWVPPIVSDDGQRVMTLRPLRVRDDRPAGLESAASLRGRGYHRAYIDEPVDSESEAMNVIKHWYAKREGG